MGADGRGFAASHEAKAYAASGGTPEGLVGEIRSDELQLAAMSGKSDPARSLWRRLAWLPVPLLAGAIVVLWAANLRTSYESPDLLIGLNFLFSVAVSLLVVYLIGRSFLARGAPGLLMLGCGVIIWGAAGFVGATAGLLGDAGRDFANITVTIHNTSVWFSAACHLVGVTLSLRQRRAFSAVWVWLMAAYAAALVVVGLVTCSAIAEWTPTFFIQGQGGTPLRQFVLGSATGMFALTAALLGWANRRFPSAFTYWYSLALTLIAVGLFGIMMEPSHGGPLSWTGRAAQFLGGAYMLIAAIVSVRESGAWEIPLEEALHRQPAFISEVLKTVGALVFVLDRQGRIVSFNRACEEATAYSALEVKGKYVWDFLLVPDEIEAVKAVIAQLQAGQFPNAHENYWVAKDGTRRLIHWTNSCLTDSFGAVEYVVGTGIEVTDRRRAEEALRASEARFRALVQNSSDIIVLLDGEGTILYQSPSIERLLGYRPEERIGRNIFHDPAVHPDDQAAKRAFFETARSRHGTPVTAEFRLRHADGSWRYVEVVGQSFLHDPEVAGVVANYRDVTERRRAEERIRYDNAVLQGINWILREALAGHTEEELGRRCLAVAEEMTQSRFGFIGEINAGGRLDAIAISRSGCEVCQIGELANHNSLPVDLEIHGIYGQAILNGEGFYTNDPAAHPDRVGTPQGHPPLSAFLGVPLKQDGKTTGLIAVANRKGGYRPQDLEALEALAAAVVQVFLRKRAEQTVRAGEERLRKAQKMESIAVLAGGVAHDFNNLLVGVIGSASLATEMLPPASSAGSLLEQIMKSGERAADLTKQLLAYSGKGQFVIERINLSEVVRQVADLVRSTVPKKVAIQLDLDPGLPAIEADRSQIDQVLMNLVINAAEAIGDEVGLVLVQTGIQFVDERFTRELESADIPPGWYLFLEVRDNGCGMDEATKAKIFDPFFTTKFQGRGLGLAAVAGIVRGHKGGIRVRTAPGRGTSIRVLFPASDSQPAPARRLAEGREEGAHIRGTVLVVDDEELVRNTAKLALETRGCDVLTASSGVDAISVVEQNADRISVAILDFSMPGMSGQEVLTKLLAISPGLSVLISSGYTEADALRLFEGMPVTGFLQKPYTVRRLVERVATALRKKPI